jgi:hypothetical protein
MCGGRHSPYGARSSSRAFPELSRTGDDFLSFDPLRASALNIGARTGADFPSLMLEGRWCRGVLTLASVPGARVPWGVNEWARGGEIECRARVRSGGDNEATRVHMKIGRTAQRRRSISNMLLQYEPIK